jgi:uncharacterized membrane protein YidH (DUF202 family)
MSTPSAGADRPSRVQQFYGYAVCLIAIVTLLIAISNLVEAAFDRADPLQAGAGRYGNPEVSLTSFEAFRATQPQTPAEPPDRTTAPVPPGPDRTSTPRADTLTTAELRARYEALRADRIARVSFDATRNLVGAALLVAVALALFVGHWRWLRGGARAAG